MKLGLGGWRYDVKIRTGLVSNSSSASFSIMLEDINPVQMYCLKNHIDFAKSIEWDDDNGKWDVDISEDMVICSTFMDNFDLESFVVEVIGIDKDLIVDREYDD